MKGDFFKMGEKINDVKALGWDDIKITSKSFSGAVQCYGDVAVAFGMHNAIILEDEEGLFGVNDLMQGVIKSKEFDVDSFNRMEGASAIAQEEDGIVHFDEELLGRLGIADSATRQSIEERLLLLASLDEQVIAEA